MSKTHLIKSWKTTVLGLILIIATIVSVYVANNITWTETTIPLAIGLGLLFSPDDVIKRVRKLISSSSSDVPTNGPCK